MQRTAEPSRSIWLYLALFIGYFIVGHLLSYVSFQSQIVPIWLPAGIALVGCYIWWLRFIPAVFIASFAFNYSVHPATNFNQILVGHGPELMLIATGACLQALVGSALLRRWLGHPLNLSSNKKIIYFILVVGILVNLISSNIGIFSLSQFNPDYSQENYWSNLVYWWLGDSLGVLLATPVLLILINFKKLEYQQKKSRILILLSSTFLFLSVLLLTGFFIDYSVGEQEKSKIREIRSIENGLYRELNNSMAQLQNLASFIQNSQDLDRDVFTRFVNELMSNQPTISGMSWNPLIQQADKVKYETQLESIYGRKVEIHGEPLDEIDPIVYVKLITPEDRNKKALGFNVYSNQKRKITLQAAETSFQPKATPIIQLVQSESKAPAYLMFFPVFKGNKQLRGYATGVFLADNMLHKALGSEGRKRFDYELYEKDKKHHFSSNHIESVLRTHHLADKLEFQLAGQVWDLYLSANKAYFLQQQSQSYLLLFVLEFVIVSFIILLILMMNSRHIELKMLVDKRTKSLKIMVEKAKDASSAKSRFLANMSHEIRTPMNAVIGFLSLARLSDDKKEVQDYLEKIEVSSDLLLNIVNDILDISKIEANKLVLSHDVFDMNISCHRINSLFKSQAEKKGLTWTLESNIPNSLYFNGDQIRFEQVLVNLCSNALKFTKQGGILVTLDVEAKDNCHSYVVVRVKDSGIGIAQEDQKKLFNAYVQADDSTSKKFGGTGLGLALSKELSRLMRGDIIINSMEGEGAEFIFHCEIETSTAAPAVRRNRTKQLDRDYVQTEDKLITRRDIKSLRVLVAEDNETNQLVIDAILQNLGIIAVIVENGLQAVDRAQQEKFDVILMDCQMPILDGYRATQKIRQIEGLTALPIFALTADVTEEGKNKADAAGFSGHLTKPIVVDKLLEALESI